MRMDLCAHAHMYVYGIVEDLHTQEAFRPSVVVAAHAQDYGRLTYDADPTVTEQTATSIMI